MNVQRSSQLTRATIWGSNLAVFALLGAVGWWGHVAHWSLPKFSDLVAARDVSRGESSAPGPLQTASSADAAGRNFPNELPPVEFTSADAARNCGIEIGVSEQRSMDAAVVANGVVDYDQTHLAQLAVRVPGIVWRVEKRVGDAVRQGDILVIVDASEVGQAKATLLEAAVVYKLKTQNLKGLREIANAIPDRELREFEAAWELARVQQFNAVQRLVNLGFPIRIEDIDRLSTDELTKRLHRLGLPATLEAESASANLIPLIAPFDGIVTNCEVVQGEMVEPSKPQYVVADMHQMWINLDVRQEDAGLLHLGSAVQFFSGEGVRPVQCTLTWVGTEIDPRTRTIQARAEAENPFLDSRQTAPGSRRLLQVNTFGSAHIMTGSNPSSVVVRNDTIRWLWEIGKEVVFVASDDGRRFEARIVRRGLTRDGYVQIVDGLQVGERVVVSGSRILCSELSDRLQARLGENAEAVRSFDEVHAAAQIQP